MSEARARLARLFQVPGGKRTVAVAAGVALALGGGGYAAAAMTTDSVVPAATSSVGGTASPGSAALASASTGDAGVVCGQVAGIVGTLKSVQGNTLTIGGPHGTVTVQTTPSTYVLTFAEGSLADVTKGSHVVAAGKRSADGTLAAQQVQVLPADVPSPGGPRPPVRVGGGGGGGTADIGVVAGTVVGKSPNGFVVAGPDGKTMSVTVSSSTTVQKGSRSSLSALQVGKQVSAFGSVGKDGRITATRVEQFAQPITVPGPGAPGGQHIQVGRGGRGGPTPPKCPAPSTMPAPPAQSSGQSSGQSSTSGA